MGALPNPKREDYESRLAYLIALTRRPDAKPRVFITETPLDVSREDEPVTIFYVYGEAQRAVRVMGVYRGQEELHPTPREIGFIKDHCRMIQRIADQPLGD